MNKSSDFSPPSAILHKLGHVGYSQNSIAGTHLRGFIEVLWILFRFILRNAY